MHFDFILANADVSAAIDSALESISQGVDWGIEAATQWLGYTAAMMLAISVFRRK